MTVWSYCLYGDNEDVYYQPLLENIRLAISNNAKIIISTTDQFEDRVRMYFSSVIDDILIRIYPSDQYRGKEMLLRYLAIDTVDADYYFIKDSDSIVTERELSIMNHWVNSADKDYMIIRDNPIHVSLIMAGMFGFRFACRDIIVKSCSNYLLAYNRAGGYGIDQRWLADEIYPKIIAQTQVYSSYFYFSNERIIRIARTSTPGSFIGAPSKGNINPDSMEQYFYQFYGHQLLNIPYFPFLPRFLSHLLYGRVRPSLYLAILLRKFKR